MKYRNITITCRVLEAMVLADDFRTSRQLGVELKLSSSQLSSSLAHLYKHQAVDCIEQPGTLWWYATPESDTRCRHMDERAPEKAPRLVKPHKRPCPRRKMNTAPRRD